VLEPSRKHGQYDRGWLASVNGAEPPVRARREEAVPGGLSWETFRETFYPGKKRHSFPAITAWSRYSDGRSS